MNAEARCWGQARKFTRSRQLFPRLEATPEFNRGDIRLAAEVALAEFRGDAIPGQALMRAVGILEVMATG